MPLVVIRHLPSSHPVTHCIIAESTDDDIDDQEHYLTCKAQESIDEFKEKFPEFKAAAFYMDIIPPCEVR